MSEVVDLDLLGLPKPKPKKEREKKEVFVVRNARDAQKLQLEKLMQNVDKKVVIPERRVEDQKEHRVPDFVRNVMGSSAGAGSGEFHVYRQLRKREATRLKLLEEQAASEALDSDFKARLAAKEKDAADKAAKKRAKRLKKKQRAKGRNKNQQKTQESSDDDSSDANEEEPKDGEDQKSDDATMQEKDTEVEKP